MLHFLHGLHGRLGNATQRGKACSSSEGAPKVSLENNLAARSQAVARAVDWALGSVFRLAMLRLFGIPSQQDVSVAIQSGDAERLQSFNCMPVRIRQWLCTDFLLGYTSRGGRTEISPLIEVNSFPLLDAARSQNEYVFDALLNLTIPSRAHYSKYLEVMKCLCQRGNLAGLDVLSRSGLPLSDLTPEDRSDIITGGVLVFLNSVEFESRLRAHVPCSRGAERRRDGITMLARLWRSGDHGLSLGSLRLDLSDDEHVLILSPGRS